MKMYLSVFIYVLMLLMVPTSIYGQKTIPTLVKQVQPSIVLINTYDSNGEKLGSGSGFFINNKGEIITNWHVISDASSAIAKSFNGAMFEVKGVIAKDKKKDLAVIKLKSTGIDFPFLSLQTKVPEKGESIFVVGNPFGLEFTVSDGLISAIRDLPNIGKVIQISAPISPGSSGSPIINLEGEVIGIASFQFTKGQNLNFSMSSIEITKLLKESTDKISPLIPELDDELSTTDVTDKATQEKIYLFTLDLIKSLTYIQKSNVSVMGSEKANFYRLSVDEEKLLAAIDRIYSWRNSNHAEIRRISEDITVTIQELISMEKKVDEIWDKCILSMSNFVPEDDPNKRACNIMFSAYFSRKSDKKLGAFYKLRNKFTDLSKELPTLITTQGLSKDSDSYIEISNDVKFLLSKNQLDEIYKYIKLSQKEISALENTSFSGIDTAFQITNLFICYEFSREKLSFPDKCSRE